MSKPLHDPLSKKLDEEARIEVKNTTCYMCACRFGRIAIANSDAAATAMFEAAVEQGHRAVLDLNQF